MTETAFVQTMQADLDPHIAKETFTNALAAQHQRQNLIMSALELSTPTFAGISATKKMTPENHGGRLFKKGVRVPEPPKFPPKAKSDEV